MASINLIEKITNLFVEGKHQQIIDVLSEESVRLKKTGKMVASKKLQNIIKKIPINKSSFVGASSNHSVKSIDISNYRENNLVKKYYSQVTPEQVILNISAKDKIENLFKEWEDFDRLSKHNLFPTNRILFYGPPGTGKTLLANAIAQHLDFPLVLVRLDELISSFLGETGKNIRDIFEIASKEPVVLFLDEIDTIAKFRSDEKELGELKRVVTVLLQNIDFFPNQSIIIGATNHDGILDKAIWRRFPLKLKLDLPDINSRKLLFKLFLKGTDHSIDYDLIANITEGLNGSEIFDIVQNAKKQSILTNSNKVTNIIIAQSYLITYNIEKPHIGSTKKTIYALCQKLKDSGLKLREIETISGIAYTTLRDNLKK
ncbi:MAG: ATP-binding protein [Candidatus Paceibacterota bacterium]|jgi:SpoVK/Ycf46/Vps4 family AAA+-type ATPase